MRKIISIAVLLIYATFFFITKSTAAVQTPVDSLLKVIPSLNDTVKLKAIENLISLSENNDKAISYSKLLLKEAQKQRNINYQALAKAKLVQFYYSQFNTDSVYRAAKEAEIFIKENHIDKYLFTVQQIVVQRYIDQGAYTLGLDKAKQMYQDAHNVSDFAGMASATSAMGSAYSQMNQYDEAIKFYKESLSLAKQSNKHAIFYAECYMNLATNLMAKENFREANSYVDSFSMKITEAKKLMGPNADLSNYVFSYELFYAICNAYQGDLPGSKKHLDIAASMFQGGMPEFYTQLLNDAWATYYRFSGDYKMALEYNRQTLEFFKNSMLGAGIESQEKQRADILNSMGNYKEAMLAYKNLIDLSDSLNRENFYNQINQLKTIYEVDKFEMQAEQARLKLQISKGITVGLVVICILLLGIVYIIWRNAKRLKEKNRGLYTKLKEQDQLYAELKKLKQKILTEPSEDEANKESKSLFERLEDYLYKTERYTEPTLTRETLALEMGTNYKYLCDAIREANGLTFNDYLNALRLDHARNLLYDLKTNPVIEDVLLSSGFTNKSTFYRLFRQKFGLTPTELKALVKEEKKNAK